MASCSSSVRYPLGIGTFLSPAVRDRHRRAYRTAACLYKRPKVGGLSSVQHPEGEGERSRLAPAGGITRRMPPPPLFVLELAAVIAAGPLALAYAGNAA